MDDGVTTREVATFRVSEKRAGLRLDRFLQECIPKLSRQGIQRAIRARVEVVGRSSKPKPSLVVRRGDTVVIRERVAHDPPPPLELEPRVLYRDDDLIAVDKPGGLAVHASRLVVRGHLIWWLRQRYGDSLALAHRLDRETSGIVVCTRGREMARRLGDDFANRRVHKEYLAIVRGSPPVTFSASTPIGHDDRSTVYTKQRAGGPGGAPSRTRFVRERLLDGDGLALVRAFPETGRRHQIRVHLASLGYPVVGDKLYSVDERFFLRYITWGLDDAMVAALGAARQLLHAAVLTLTHPRTGETLRLEAPPPADFGPFLEPALTP